jgi:mannose-6-phosphate isomerase-like protein (cupin superfamily)
VTEIGVVSLSEAFVGLERSGRARVFSYGDGAPPSVDGHTVGAARMNESPPHDGERHPDGDELLYLVAGRITVVLEEPTGDRHVGVAPGEAMIVPQGVWHRVLVDEPCHLVYVTPGPHEEHRHLR